MTNKISKSLLNDAEKLINNPDKEILALSLGSNPNAKDNYQMAMAIKLKNSLFTSKSYPPLKVLTSVLNHANIAS